MRTGIGYDVHAFDKAPGPRRPLVLGGVEITTSTQWLEGWSDADVLTHAIIDALLGAAALGDIGSHFPSDDEKYKGISSLILLEQIRDELARKHWQIINIDSIVVAEWPKIIDFIKDIRSRISHTLGIDISQVSVKAETSGTIGYAGRGDGIGCFATVLLEGSEKGSKYESI